jgi:23S rRNA pseudouridine1911/1915/1917 synthase
MENKVLFEDNHILIINKNPSDIVQGDKTGDLCLVDIAKIYIKEKYNKPGEVFLGLVHRIDRPVSGAVILARTSKALSRLNEMLKNHEIKKTYWAVVKNKPPQEKGQLVDFLIKNEKQNKSYVVEETRKGALKAELNYSLVAKSDNYYLLEVELISGRHHQIRAQLANMGCPVKGDLKYGFDRSNKDASIHLHSRKIKMLHPVKKELIEVIAPTPDDPIWNYFEKTIQK